MNDRKYVITNYDADAMRSKPLPGSYDTIEAALAKIGKIQGRYHFMLMVDLASAFESGPELETQGSITTAGARRADKKRTTNLAA